MSRPPRAGARTLWLPLRAVRGAWLAAGAVLLFYVLTMARDLSFYDSAELALVAKQGGLGHPLGQPLHTWLGWVFMHVPGVPALLGLNFLSALATALTVLPLTSIAEGLAGEDPPDTPSTLRSAVWIPFGVAVVFAHPVLWENGSRVEVYPLALLFGLWAVARCAASLAPRPEGGAGWFGAGLALGLAASANAYLATFIALGLAPAVGAALWRRRLSFSQALRAVGGGLTGLLPFVHIFLVAGRKDAFVWGAPTGGEALTRYLTNADFDHYRGITAAGLADHVGQWSLWALDHGLLPVVGLGLVAHALWGRRAGLGRLWAAIVFALVVYVICINTQFWPQVSDFLGYLAVPVAVLGAGAWVLALRLARYPRLDPRLARGAGLVVAVVLTASLTLSAPAVHHRTRDRDRVARTLAEGALADAPPHAILIVESDHWAFPMLYLQEAERTRPDVVILPLGLSGASWYWAHLFHRHPKLKPFPLRGPGGRRGRVQRLRAANPTRPVLYESFRLALLLGTPGCPGRWLLRDPNACGFPGAQGPDRLTAAIEKMVDRVGEGSPPAGRVLSRVALDRGEILWRYGLPAEALRAFRAGVPAAHRPPLPRTDVARAGRLNALPHRWKRDELIGHWTRNLWFAARLLHAADRDRAAAAHLQAAAVGGLPEAQP